jgi:hypothetical protein
MTSNRISAVVFSRAKAEPSIVKSEANTVLTALKQLGVILHHALETSGGLEHCTLGVCVFRVHKLRDNTSSACEVGYILWDLEKQSVCVSGETGVAFIVGNIALRVPLGLQQRFDLVVFDANDYFFTGIFFVDKTADSSKGLSRHTWDTDRIHLPVVYGRYAQHGRDDFESKGVSILNEDHPFLAHVAPLGRHSTIEQ